MEYNDVLSDMNQKIIDLENIKLRLDDRIRQIWDDVMVPYVQTKLCELSTEDYNKFYSFMITENDLYQTIHNEINMINLDKLKHIC